MSGLTSAARLRAGIATGFAVAVFSACGQSQRVDRASGAHSGEAGATSGGRTSGGSGGRAGGSAANGGSQATGGSLPTGGNGIGGGSGGATAGFGGGGAGDAGEACRQSCSAECPCPPGTGPLPLVCLSPGDSLCAGPPPPPDECATDAECADAGAGRICEPSGHCNAWECVAGCATVEDCTEAEACGADQRCVPKPCTTGDSCGPNHRCGGDGSCERVPCERSADCNGVCVNRLCYDTAGSCGDPSAP
jgi:hypothetical protein